MSPASALAFLVVDDQPAARRAVRERVARIGAGDVEEADGAVAALQLLQRRRFDFVIAAVNMSRTDGFGLLQSIKSDPALRHLPVLMVAAEPRKDELVRAAQAGAAGYIVKPVEASMLELKVRRILQRQAQAA